jgi:FixJ family two-component response regulator
MSHATPTVFVVDDDISVRESLELLIASAGWRPEIFASAQEFLSRPRSLLQTASSLTWLFRTSMVSICKARCGRSD